MTFLFINKDEQKQADEQRKQCETYNLGIRGWLWNHYVVKLSDREAYYQAIHELNQNLQNGVNEYNNKPIWRSIEQQLAVFKSIIENNQLDEQMLLDNYKTAMVRREQQLVKKRHLIGDVEARPVDTTQYANSDFYQIEAIDETLNEVNNAIADLEPKESKGDLTDREADWLDQLRIRVIELERDRRRLCGALHPEQMERLLEIRAREFSARNPVSLDETNEAIGERQYETAIQ